MLVCGFQIPPCRAETTSDPIKPDGPGSPAAKMILIAANHAMATALCGRSGSVAPCVLLELPDRQAPRDSRRYQKNSARLDGCAARNEIIVPQMRKRKHSIWWNQAISPGRS